MNWRIEIVARLGALHLDAQLEGDGRPVVLVGPNGAGKTTLLRIIAGAQPAASGCIRVGERTLWDTAAAIDRPPEDRRVGYVPQGYGLFPHLSALDNVAFGLAHGPTHQAKGPARNTATALLERLGCASLAQRMPASLSGGERQRIALARALVVDPDLLLLDEPLSALDIASRRVMRAFLVQHLAARAKPAIVITHDPRDIRALDAEVFVLEAGRIVQRGTASQLRDAPATPFVAELFDAHDPVVAAPDHHSATLSTD